ncbi:MAG: 4-hydroxy-tetrahydrodipicolinate synthase [Verrucomicrobia bacterium]|nr:MAG: 4-hydroxy-tetrahydrodipicolinate synthase [Verrucomicrobiota bacterium]
MFAGVHTALATPFRNGQIDAAAFKRLIDFQFDNGIQGVVPAGTTGESPTLGYEEHDRIIELAIEYSAGRGLVIAGTGSNATAEAVQMTQAAEKAGAQASLQVCPYYNKPSQAGLVAHFKAIADSTSLPIILYSVPGRCGVEIGVETVATLAVTCRNIVAIKEAGGSAERVSQLVAATPEGFQVLSGDDSLTLPFISVGACGVISVASNLIPSVMSELVAKANEGNFTEALAIHEQHYALFNAFLKLDTNPVPIKAALALRGLMENELRLPLLPLDAVRMQQVRTLLEDLNLL